MNGQQTIIEETLFGADDENRQAEVRVTPRLKQLERRVFTFASSEADRKYFLIEFYKWLKNECYFEGEWKSFTQLLWKLTWVRNDNGKHIKYLFFNEYVQKLYLDRDFYEWAKLALNEVEATMEKASG